MARRSLECQDLLIFEPIVRALADVSSAREALDEHQAGEKDAQQEHDDGSAFPRTMRLGGQRQDLSSWGGKVSSGFLEGGIVPMVVFLLFLTKQVLQERLESGWHLSSVRLCYVLYRILSRRSLRERARGQRSKTMPII
jgi:hypothetical protein